VPCLLQPGLYANLSVPPVTGFCTAIVEAYFFCRLEGRAPTFRPPPGLFSPPTAFGFFFFFPVGIRQQENCSHFPHTSVCSLTFASSCAVASLSALSWYVLFFPLSFERHLPCQPVRVRFISFFLGVPPISVNGQLEKKVVRAGSDLLRRY